MTKYERYSLVISGFALIFSIGSIIVSVWAQIQNTQSNIKVSIIPDKSGNVRFEESNNENVIFFKRRFIARLSNIGNTRLSIVGYSITPFIGRSSYIDATQYLVMDPMLLDSDNNQIKFPFSIESREVRELFLVIGVAVPEDAWLVIKEVIALDKDIPYSQAYQIFWDAGFLGFGQVDSDKQSIYSYQESEHFTNYEIVFEKEDGKSTIANFDATDLYTIREYYCGQKKSCNP